ncbi:MAG: response regulator [Candidatus Acidiferrales bacterium]
MAIRILIVDDSAIFRQDLRETLEAEVNWEVCGEAVDGFEAILKNRLLGPQLIVMDLSMPRMTGIEAAFEILRDFPEVPILLLTLYSTPQLAEHARNIGIRATLSKTAMHRLVGDIQALLGSDHSGNGRARGIASH